MKKLFTATFLVCMLFSNSLPAAFEECSCSADDGTCSASVACPGGCIAFCPSGGCHASCAGKGFGGLLDYTMPVSLQLAGSNSKKMTAELSRITGAEVVFLPFKQNATFSLDVKNASLWEVLEMLSDSGKLEIGGEDFSKLRTIRKALVTGERMSVCVHKASVQRLVRELAYLSGLPIHVTSGDSTRLVDFSVKGVALDDIIAHVSDLTGVEISAREIGVSQAR